MTAARASRRLDASAAAAVGILAAALGLHPVITPDIWWHLASGRWILDHGTVPRTDPFTYTAADHAWVNLQWLGDVGAAELYRWGGADGLILLKMLALAGVAALLYAAARRAGAGVVASAAAVTVAVLAGAERTMVRPEIASYVLLATTLLLVGEVRAGRRWPVAGLPALTAVWINLHSLAFLAPLTILLHALVELAPRSTSIAPVAPAASPAARRLFLSGGLSALALLLNPYGVAAWTFPAALFQRVRATSGAFRRVLEFASPADDPGDPALRLFWLLMALTAASLFAPKARDRARRFACVAPFLVLALLARRNVPLFAIAAAPVLARNVTDAVGPVMGRWRGLAILLPLAVTVAVALGASPGLLGLHREPGLGVSPGLFPDACVSALEKRNSPGNLFNEMDFGGYVTWRLPDRRTFIDGRLEVAGAPLLEDYLRAHEDPAAWRRTRQSWNIDTLLLHHAEAGSAAFLRALLQSGEWTLRCASPEAVLLAAEPDASTLPDRPPPDLRPTVDTWARLLAEARAAQPEGGRSLAFVADPLDRLVARSPSPAAVRRAARLAGLCLQMGWLDEAREGYARVLEVAPNDPDALFNAGVCDVRAGRTRAASERWTAALSRVPPSRRAMFRDALDRLAAGDAPPGVR